jgi:hypothetical protein
MMVVVVQEEVGLEAQRGGAGLIRSRGRKRRMKRRRRRIGGGGAGGGESGVAEHIASMCM